MLVGIKRNNVISAIAIIAGTSAGTVMLYITSIELNWFPRYTYVPWRLMALFSFWGATTATILVVLKIRLKVLILVSPLLWIILFFSLNYALKIALIKYALLSGAGETY